MGGGEEIKYVIKSKSTFQERLMFAITGSINGDPSKIFKMNSTDMIGKRNATVVTVFGIYVMYKILKKPKKEKMK